MDFILNPFVTVLTFLYRILGNDMVLSIAVFTVLVRLITYPLTIQQQRSSRAMQQVQPELKKLQEKYKNDREKLAQEQMALYRQYGINPLGGCLPLVIQFPIFIALYQTINMALATTPTQMLNTAGRLLIPGLDSVVPLNNQWLGMDLTTAPNLATIGQNIQSFIPVILIGLVGLTTYLQFKATAPKAVPNADGKPDQAQAMTQSMGTIMPIMYVFFALSFSVGLSIYFIVSNTVGIVQYTLINRSKLKMQAADASKVSLMSTNGQGDKKKIRPATAAEKSSSSSVVSKPRNGATRARADKQTSGKG